jgi:DNA-binding NarL/FixJ family response regulator
VTLLDVGTLVHIRREFADAKAIVLSAHRGAFAARRALQGGAAGYLPKNVSREELLEAIRAVAGGARYVSAELANDLADGLGRDDLSPAEADVLRLVAAGYSNKRVGAALQVPQETVKSRMKSILRKLGALDRTHSVTLALVQGIIATD